MSWPLLWPAALLLGLALASVVVAAALVVSLPPTYFLDDPAEARRADAPAARWAARVLKNLLGGVLVAAGILMLLTPGQGVLTILLGLLLLDLPGKRSLERKLVSRPQVRQALNRLRARFGRPPLVLEEPGPGTGSGAAR